MTNFVVKCTAPGGQEREKDVASRSEAEDKKQELKDLGFSDIRIVDTENNVDVVETGTGTADDSEAIDGGDATSSEATPTEATPAPHEQQQPPAEDPAFGDALDELGESLETDPLSILPGHMIDTIQGQPAVNKRGYAMIAERYGVSVKSYIESYPWENDEGRCVARAVAITEEGKEYQDYATASDDDGDMPEQLIELASTRALKRVAGWATGLGIVSYQELSGQLEDEL